MTKKEMTEKIEKIDSIYEKLNSQEKRIEAIEEAVRKFLNPAKYEILDECMYAGRKCTITWIELEKHYGEVWLCWDWEWRYKLCDNETKDDTYAWESEITAK